MGSLSADGVPFFSLPLAVSIALVDDVKPPAGSRPPGFVSQATLLTGRWVESPGSKLNAFTRRTLWCHDDRSFTEECKVFDPSNKEDLALRWSLGGTWRVEGETLILDAILTTRADLDPTGTWRYGIVSLSQDELTLRLDGLPGMSVPADATGRTAHYHWIEMIRRSRHTGHIRHPQDSEFFRQATARGVR